MNLSCKSPGKALKYNISVTVATMHVQVTVNNCGDLCKCDIAEAIRGAFNRGVGRTDRST